MNWWSCCCSPPSRGATIKPLAKALLQEFKSFAGLVSASRERLEAAGLGESAVDLLKTVREAALRSRARR